MEKADWRGKSETEEALQLNLRESGSSTEFLQPERMPHWCFIHFIQLPAYLLGKPVELKVGKKIISRWSALNCDDAKHVPEALANAIAPWIS